MSYQQTFAPPALGPPERLALPYSSDPKSPAWGWSLYTPGAILAGRPPDLPGFASEVLNPPSSYYLGQWPAAKYAVPSARKDRMRARSAVRQAWGWA